MMNLNEENDIGSWPLYYENKLFNDRQFFNSFPLHPARDVYLGSDKEVVKRMMLKHEAIFRNQVCELHCLYKMQRALMEELKRQEAHKYPISVEASHSNAHSSHKPSEEAKIFSHFPSVSPVKSACSRASISGTEKMQSHLNFIKPNITKADSSPQDAGNFGDCTLIELNTRKASRRMLDLQLPAEVYFDSEDGDQIDEEHTSQASVVENNGFKANRGLPLENDIKLCFGTNENLDRQGLASKPTGHLGKKNGLVDLNQPILVEEASSSASVNNFLGSAICDEGNQRRDLLSIKQIGFPGELFQNIQRADKGLDGRHNLSSNKFQSGLYGTSMNLQDSGADRFPNTSKIVKDEFKEAYASPMFLLPDSKKAEPWTQNTNFGADDSARKSVLNHNLWGQVSAIPMVNQCLVPDASKSESLSGSSMRKPINVLNHNQDAFRGVDCFNSSGQPSKSSNASIQCLKFNGSKWHPNDHPKSNSSFGTELSNRRGSLHGFLTEVNALQARSPLADFDFLNFSGKKTLTVEHFENNHSSKYLKGLDCKDMKSRKDMNLNLAVQDESQEGTTEQRTLLIVDGEMKNEDSLGALPRFKRNLDSNQHSTSASHDAEHLRIETNVRIDTKKIFGVPILDKPHDSKMSFFGSSDKKRHRSFSEEVYFQSSKAVKVLDVDLIEAPRLCDSSQQLQMEKVVAVKEDCEGLSGSRNQFDLNSCASEEEPLVLPSIPTKSTRIALEIDLEIPLVPETEEAVFPDQYVESRYKMAIQSSTTQDRSQNQIGEPVHVAAEVLVSISSSFVANHSKYDIQHVSEASVSDSLTWLAEVVSSCASALATEEGLILRNKGILELATLENSSYESDYFELMTLKLTELKAEEKWRESSGAPDNQNDEETIGGNFLLPTRRRRGQAKRGRQRKDFQRDILPSIASLSRHEVTEDLQTIGGLMRATGQPWQTALERRNAARNGWARGRRRSRGAASSVAEVATCVSPPRIPENNYISNSSNNNELGLEEKCLKGWGKTTRRQRCQRFVAGNPPPVPLAQV